MARNIAHASLCALGLLSVSACVSAQELRAQDEAACIRYGFRPGTADFAACLQQQDLARDYSYSAGPAIGLGFGFGL